MAQCSRRTRRAFARIGSGTSLCLRDRMPRAAARLPGAELGREAKQRVRWIDYARTHSVSATCRPFGIARSTDYRWATRYDPQRLSLLETRSSRPRRCRRPTWTATHAAAVRQTRQDAPRWGKDSLTSGRNSPEARHDAELGLATMPRIGRSEAAFSDRVHLRPDVRPAS